MKNFNIAVIEGDGIGPEIVREAIKVIEKAIAKYDTVITWTPVLAGGCAIDATGTPLPQETVDVCLAQGKVDVHFNEKTSSLPNVVMKPNQMVSYNKSSAKMDLTEVDTSDALAWVGGSLSFHEASFVEMSKQLERKFNVRIQIKSTTLKNEIFTGSFDNHYSLEEILQEVDIDKKYTWSRKDSNLIIYDRMK